MTSREGRADSAATVVLRPRSAGWISAASWALCALLLVDAVVRAGAPGLRVLPLLAAASAIIWALLWAPRVILREREVEVRNVLVTHHLPFKAIRRVRLGAMLRLDAVDAHGRERTVTAWNAPGTGRDRPTRHHGHARHGRAPRHIGAGERLALDQRRSPSAVVGQRFEAWAAVSERDGADRSGPVTAVRAVVRPNIGVLMVLGVCAAALAVRVLAF